MPLRADPGHAQPARLRLAAVGMRGVPSVIGGIETHCALLYPALAEHAPWLDILLLTRRPFMAYDRGRLGDAEVVALPSPRRSPLETLVHTALAMFYAKRRSVDAIHLHGIGPGFFAPLARLLGMKVVVTHHAADFRRPRWGVAGRLFLRLGEQLAGRFAHRVICVSDALQRDFLSRVPGAAARTATIRHGAALTAASPEADREVVTSLGLEPGRYLLAVGRIEETKRFEDLIAAHAAARRDSLPLVIVGAAVGDATYERELHAASGPRIHFTGFRTGAELAALFRDAALFIHPSAMEGFGLVVLEALIAGLPVHISDIPPHREFGLPENRYFPVGDISALTALIEGTAPRIGPCAESMAIASRYSLAGSVAAHAALFAELAGQPAVR